jgi:hypothetical protein
MSQCSADAVEKVAARRVQSAVEKIDLLDRPTNRSRTPVKGKKTHENLARKMASDFFNSIGQLQPFGRAPGRALKRRFRTRQRTFTASIASLCLRSKRSSR